MSGRVIYLTLSGWLFAVLLTVISLQGCNQDDCGSFDVGKINSFDLVVYAIGEKMSGQTQDQYIIIDYNGEGVSYDSTLIELQLIVDQVSNYYFGLTSSFACSPAPPYIDIIKISITSDADYNADYPAGENLVDIFQVQNDLAVKSGLDFKEYVNNRRGKLDGWERYYLSISEQPTELRSHSFKIEFTLRDASVIAMSTQEMLIR